MAEETYLTPEERLAELGDDILYGALTKSKNRQLLFGDFTPNIFRNENYIIYYVMYNFKDKGIVPDAEFLELYLVRNISLIKESSEFIDVSAYADLDESKELAYVSAVLAQYNRLLTFDKDIDNDAYKLLLEKYKLEYSSIEASKAYTDARIILYDGLQVGRTLYQGYSDSTAYLKKKLADIDALLDHTAGAGFIDASVAGIEDTATSDPIKIGDFDLISELNEQFGGIYTSTFMNVLAPTKGGKSKFCTRLIHTILVQNGVNASVWAHEGGHVAFFAQLRAIHYEYMYIRNKPESERPAPVSQADILYNKYPSDDVRALEQASRLDLFTNPNYGNLYMIDRPFYAETLIEELETSVQLNNSQAIMIDYLQLIGTKNTSRKKPEVIGKAYQDVLGYCKKRNLFVVSPSQFTQEFMKEMAASKDGQQHEVRSAGGESAEIIRTPDVNIALYATADDITRKEMTLMSVPSRVSIPFPDTKIYADLCSCVFSSFEN